MRFQIVVVTYTLWLIAIFGALYVTHGNNSETALQLALMTGALPASLQIFLLGVDWRGLVAPMKMWLAFLVIVLVSYCVNGLDPSLTPAPNADAALPPAWNPVIYTLNVIFILGIGTLIAGCPDRRLLRSIASLYCVLLTPFLVYVIITGARVWGNRLEANELQANVWGMVGASVCLTALARKAGLLTFAGFGVGIATVLAASSRESLIAVAAGLPVIAALEWRSLKQARLMMVLAGSCAVLIAVAVLLDPYVFNAIHYVKSDVLMLDDPRRGVDSGFTGRTGLWEAAFDVWMKSPLLGVGYRMHEQFLPNGMPGHNAYLAMLADTGLVGFVWYIVLFGSSLVAAFGIEDRRTRRFVVTLIITRVVSGFFDRITINGGNIYSLFFVLCCSVALADHSLRRAGAFLREKGLPVPATFPLGLQPPRASH